MQRGGRTAPTVIAVAALAAMVGLVGLIVVGNVLAMAYGARIVAACIVTAGGAGLLAALAWRNRSRRLRP